MKSDSKKQAKEAKKGSLSSSSSSSSPSSSHLSICLSHTHVVMIAARNGESKHAKATKRSKIEAKGEAKGEDEDEIESDVKEIDESSLKGGLSVSISFHTPLLSLT
jgi:hypothetical protein